VQVVKASVRLQYEAMQAAQKQADQEAGGPGAEEADDLRRPLLASNVVSGASGRPLDAFWRRWEALGYDALRWACLRSRVSSSFEGPPRYGRTFSLPYFYEYKFRTFLFTIESIFSFSNEN
jgi:hypothetical protein